MCIIYILEALWLFLKMIEFGNYQCNGETVTKTINTNTVFFFFFFERNVPVNNRSGCIIHPRAYERDGLTGLIGIIA